MIVYLDTSVLVRAFLPDEEGHAAARTLLDGDDAALVTGSWTRIEIAAALARAACGGRTAAGDLLDAALESMNGDGPVTVVAAPQRDIERIAFRLARERGLQAMDAWHVACAAIVLPQLAEGQEVLAFATRDADQAAAAQAFGFHSL